jgi:hypothetical protein
MTQLQCVAQLEVSVKYISCIYRISWFCTFPAFFSSVESMQFHAYKLELWSLLSCFFFVISVLSFSDGIPFFLKNLPRLLVTLPTERLTFPFNTLAYWFSSASIFFRIAAPFLEVYPTPKMLPVVMPDIKPKRIFLKLIIVNGLNQ